MLSRLHHRGPDDRGWAAFQGGDMRSGREVPDRLEAQVLLLSTRLAILDLSEAGHQPMSTEDGRYWIAFNGEIYNFVELRAELESLGHTFRSRTDTEVLLKAWAQWGPDALPRLIGMFAFGVLDTRERKVFLARDFFGIKPLYYASWKGGFAFASEPPVLLDLRWTSRRVNPERLYTYLRFGTTDHGGETMFADVHQVPAAHWLEVDLARPGATRLRRYWDARPSATGRISFDDAAEELRRLFEESVEIHLRSDVTVGAALSGGIDSSANVMAMRAAAGDAIDLHTFTYVTEDDSINEEHWAELVGRAARAEGHRVRVSDGDLDRDLDDLIDIQGEPFGSTSIYAQHRVFRLARESGIKVMLDGQGADELFAGYRTALGFRLASLMRQRRPREAARLLSAIRRLPGIRPAILGLTALPFLIPSALQPVARKVARRDRAPRWLDAEWFQERDGTLQATHPSSGKSILKDHLHRLIFETSLPHLLRYEDRNSMAFSIESRVPFLTPELASFALSLPESYIVGRDGVSKAVFRQAMRGLVPDAVLDRTDKVGFSTPEAAWLRRSRSWVEGILRSDTARSLGALEWPVLIREWESGVSGARPLSPCIWRWINVVRWVDRFEVASP